MGLRAWEQAYRSGMRVTYNKLIRDRIPEIIEANGHRAVTRVLKEEDYRAALLAKLVEEAREAETAPDDELADELADVWEVFQALVAALPLAQYEIEALAAAKRGKRGGFGSRILLEYTEQAPGTPGA
jgi:predicted house-cleaning noncanonical NTP pyrophosphatase (MazG superfamily)